MKRLLGFATAFAVLGTLLSIPAVMPADTANAQLFATVGLVIDIAIEGDIDWGTVDKNAHNVTPPDPVDEYWIRILPTTTTSVDLQAMAENSPEYAGMYTANSGGDNNIENIQFWKL
ncbi:MAG: hypothetical protein QW704_02330, partial [Candidatus Hadarchaeales archaeon]